MSAAAAPPVLDAKKSSIPEAARARMRGDIAAWADKDEPLSCPFCGRATSPAVAKVECARADCWATRHIEALRAAGEDL